MKTTLVQKLRNTALCAGISMLVSSCDGAPSNNAESIDVTKFIQQYGDTKVVSKADLRSTTLDKLPEYMKKEIKAKNPEYTGDAPILTADYETTLSSGTVVLFPDKSKSITGYFFDSLVGNDVKKDLFQYDDLKMKRRLEHKPQPQMGPIKPSELENKLNESTTPLPPITNIPDSEPQDNLPNPEVKTNVVYVSNTKRYIATFFAGLALGAIGMYALMRKRN